MFTPQILYKAIEVDDTAMIRKCLSSEGFAAQLVTAENLNLIIQRGVNEGINIIWMLCATSEGLELLKNPLLRAKLTSENLAASCRRGVKKGTNAIWWLCSTEAGVKLLKEDPHLRAQLTSDSLGTILQCDSYQGINAVWSLCSTIIGLELLDSDQHLRAKLTGESLGATANCGSHQGINAAWWLCATPKGRLILAGDKELRKKFTANSLKVAPLQGTQEGKSAIWWLCSTVDGRSILQADSKLRAKLTASLLSTGPHWGKKTVYYLIENQVWIPFIASSSRLKVEVVEALYNDLCSAIFFADINRIAWCLQNGYDLLIKSTEGHQIATLDDRFYSKRCEALRVLKAKVGPLPPLRLLFAHSMQQASEPTQTSVVTQPLEQPTGNILIPMPKFFKPATTATDIAGEQEPQSTINLEHKKELTGDGAFTPVKRARTG